MKSGYPPQSLTIIPELSLSSLGLKAGEQIIVNQKPDLGPQSKPHPTTSGFAPLPTSQSSQPRNNYATQTPSSSTRPQLSPSSSPEHVTTDGGVLIHRVRKTSKCTSQLALNRYPPPTRLFPMTIHACFHPLLSCSSKISPKQHICGKVRMFFLRLVFVRFTRIRVVAEGIEKDPVTYNESILG